MGNGIFKINNPENRPKSLSLTKPSVVKRLKNLKHFSEPGPTPDFQKILQNKGNLSRIPSSNAAERELS